MGKTWNPLDGHGRASLAFLWLGKEGRNAESAVLKNSPKMALEHRAKRRTSIAKCTEV
jgi:hypothetical protein